MPHTNFKRVALDRNKWRYLCQSGIRNFEISRIDRLKDERQRRKALANIPVTLSRYPRCCTLCGLVRKSLAGLKCHIQHKHKN